MGCGHWDKLSAHTAIPLPPHCIPAVVAPGIPTRCDGDLSRGCIPHLVILHFHSWLSSTSTVDCSPLPWLVVLHFQGCLSLTSTAVLPLIPQLFNLHFHSWLSFTSTAGCPPLPRLDVLHFHSLTSSISMGRSLGQMWCEGEQHHLSDMQGSYTETGTSCVSDSNAQDAAWTQIAHKEKQRERMRHGVEPAIITPDHPARLVISPP